jgi:hypothetical protein
MKFILHNPPSPPKKGAKLFTGMSCSFSKGYKLHTIQIQMLQFLKKYYAPQVHLWFITHLGLTVLKYVSGVLHVIKMVDYGRYWGYALFNGLHSEKTSKDC